MNAIDRLLLRAYRAILHLYPSGFRQDLADEVADVFTAILRDSATLSSPRRWRLIVCEFIDAVRGLIREHQRVLLSPALDPTTPPTRIGLARDVVAFALTYALARAAAQVRMVPDLLIYLCAGWLIGTLLSHRLGRRPYRVGFILGGMLVFAGGMILTDLAGALLAIGLAVDIGLISALTRITEPLLIGALAGALLGLADRSRRRVVGLTGVGLLGFSGGVVAAFLLSVLLWGLLQAVDSYRPGYTGIPSAWVAQGGQWLQVIVFPAISALIGGALLGRLAKAPTRRWV